MEQKKYTDVIRLGHRSTVGVLNEGDYIVIQEKIDGANASFRRDGDVVLAFSRNIPLGSGNNLGGFYEWAQTLNVDKLLDGVIYFGEWTNKHKVSYEGNQKKFYLFDIHNTNIEEYVDFSMVKDEARRLNLNLVPVFYEGKYQSFEHLQSFVGRTELNGKLGDLETGEGIVVKNVKYKDRFDKQVFVKLVTEDFREVQKQKEAKDPNFQSVEMQFISECLTKARVEKIIYKLVDEDILHEHFGVEDMGLILRHMSNRIYDDIMKEESDSLDTYEEKDIRKCIGKRLPLVVKQIINEKDVA
jgi:hypothetical protein